MSQKLCQSSQTLFLRDAIRTFKSTFSSKSVQLLQKAFLHIDVTNTSVNPISGGTSCTNVNPNLHGSI